MNRIHNVIWSKAQGAWVVVAEGTKAASKAGGAGLKVMIALIMLSPITGQAANLPQGGSITVGQGTIVNNGANEMVIKQTTDKLGVNWQSFNVGADGHVIFDQPGAHSVALNRVIGSDGSAILGRIDANGQVFLVNPNGVIFGKDAKVNVGGLVASTLNITDEDFKNGDYKFATDMSSGDVRNDGELHAAAGGYIALLGKTVKNNGLIKAQLGTAALAAGSAVTLDFTGDGLINVQVSKSAVDALVENHGAVQADGGSILMTARSTNALLDTVINNDGVVQAQTINSHSGKIFLDGGSDGGTVLVAGTLDASAEMAGNGGFIETSGRNVVVSEDAAITTAAKQGSTGSWLIDPTNFTIGQGTAGQTASGISATALQKALAVSNVTLETQAAGTEAGNINVNAEVTWSADTALTLSAAGDIYVNKVVSVNGNAGGLNLNYGKIGTDTTKDLYVDTTANISLNGANSTFAMNGIAATVIRSIEGFSAVAPTGIYVLATDIDASSSSSMNSGKGFAPIAGEFSGKLNGLGHKITNLHIARSDESSVGLFSSIKGGRVSNLGISGDVVGANNVGLLAGQIASGVIKGVNVAGTVQGNTAVGGLAGFTKSSTIYSVNADVGVTGTTQVGGLIGSSLNSGISYSSSKQGVKGQSSVGGLIGYDENGRLNHVYSLSSVEKNGTAGQDAGGLIGLSNGSEVRTAYARGAVSGGDNVGGLIGRDTNVGSNILGAYTEGSVTGKTNVGGFIGSANGTVLSQVYSLSSVDGDQKVGGLVGNATAATLSNSYAAGSVIGNNYLGGLIGYATNTAVGQTYSKAWVTSYADSATKGGLIGYRSGGTVDSSFYSYYAGNQVSAGGTYVENLEDASNYAGWDISSEGGTSNVWRIYNGMTAPLLTLFMGKATVVSGNDAHVTYSGDTVAAWDAFTTIKQTITYQSTDSFWDHSSGWIEANDWIDNVRNAGTYSYAKSYSSQLGYNITEKVAPQLIVDKALLNVSALAQNKTYDGTTSATVTFGDNRLGSDDLQVSASAQFADKNAGAGKTVNVSNLVVKGADAGNYYWNPALSATADILKASLKYTATGVDKTYDASTKAQVSFTDNRVNGDNITLSSASAVFADKNAGAGKAIQVTGVSLSGADAGNYTWANTANASANIAKAQLKLSATADSKYYDGTTAAHAVLSDDHLQGDDIRTAFSGAHFETKNASPSTQAVLIEGIQVTGADAQNYQWTLPVSPLAFIYRFNLEVTAHALNKVYDGTTAASVSLTDNRIAGDDLTITAGSAEFSDKNAGAGKTVTASGFAMSGSDSDNYNIQTITSTSQSDIAKANLVLKADDGGKTAGQADPVLTWSIQDGKVFDGDAITGSPVRTAGEDAGAYAINDGTLSAGDNYSVSVTPGTFTIASVPVTPEEPVVTPPEPEEPVVTPPEPEEPVVTPPEPEEPVVTPPEPEEPVVTPPEPEEPVVTPPEPEEPVVTPPEPEEPVVTPPEPEEPVVTPPEPEEPVVTPPEPEEPVVTPPEPEEPVVTPPEPEEPVVTPPEPEEPVVTPPEPEEPVVTPPEPEEPVVTPPEPEEPVVTPPEPEEPVVTPPEPEEPVVTPPEPEEPVVTPPEPEEPVVTPPEPEEPVVTPPEPEVKPEEPVVTPPQPEVKPEEPVVTPPVPEVKPEDPVVISPEPEVKPENPVVTPQEPEVNPETPLDPVTPVTPEQPVSPGNPVVPAQPEERPNVVQLEKAKDVVSTVAVLEKAKRAASVVNVVTEMKQPPKATDYKVIELGIKLPEDSSFREETEK